MIHIAAGSSATRAATSRRGSRWARAILVLTGKGERELAGLDGALRARISVARDLGEASAQILAGHAAQGR